VEVYRMRRFSVLLLSAAGLLVGALGLSSCSAIATFTYTTALSGANEVPPTTSPISDNVTVTLNEVTQTVCAYLNLQNVAVSDIAAMHIHPGAAGMNGPVVIPFTVGATSCATGVDRVLIEQIVADPAGFYFNVHTAEFPGGAARGQLARVAPSPTKTSLAGSLSSANEVPPNATPTSGPVLVIVDTATNLVCVTLNLQNQTIENIRAMHIHNAAAGVNGPIVVPFPIPAIDTCAIGPDAVVDDLVANPANYYFNVHTAAFPAGEARAQLALVPPPSDSTSTTTASK